VRKRTIVLIFGLFTGCVLHTVGKDSSLLASGEFLPHQTMSSISLPRDETSQHNEPDAQSDHLLSINLSVT
jgi:hypothetical protein